MGCSEPQPAGFPSVGTLAKIGPPAVGSELPLASPPTLARCWPRQMLWWQSQGAWFGRSQGFPLAFKIMQWWSLAHPLHRPFEYPGQNSDPLTETVANQTFFPIPSVVGQVWLEVSNVAFPFAFTFAAFPWLAALSRFQDPGRLAWWGSARLASHRRVGGGRLVSVNRDILDLGWRRGSLGLSTFVSSFGS